MLRKGFGYTVECFMFCPVGRMPFGFRWYALRLDTSTALCVPFCSVPFQYNAVRCLSVVSAHAFRCHSVVKFMENGNKKNPSATPIQKKTDLKHLFAQNAKGGTHACGRPDYSKQPLRTERSGSAKAKRRHPRMGPPRLSKATSAHGAHWLS